MPTRTIDLSTSSFDLPSTVRGAKDPVMIGPGETLWATRTPDGIGTLRMDCRSTGRVEAEAWGSGADWLLNQAPRLLGVDDDLTDFSPPPGPLRDLWRRRPFRLARTDRPWDALVGGVFGQKVQVANAVKSRRLLARRYGDRAPGPATGWVLQAPERVAELGYHHLHPFGVERKRADTLIRVAREMARMGDLSERSPESFKARLQRIRGLGPWTAAMVSAVTLGDADAVPVGDYHIPNTVAWALAGEPRATDARMLELLEPWAGHRWRIVRLAKSSGRAPKYGPKLSLTDDGLHLGR